MKALILFQITLTSFGIMSSQAAVLYVDLNSTNPVPPYSQWTTAATNIQDAIDASVALDTVIVSDGVYNSGGRVTAATADGTTNRVVVDKAVTLWSANGPSKTSIEGFPVMGNTAIRCVYLTNGASLIGFTLTNGSTRSTHGSGNPFNSGGGVFCASSTATVSNCFFIGNSANFYGGGAYQGAFFNCTFWGNFGVTRAGAVYNGSLTGCLIVSNTTGLYGGGVNGCSLTNCTVIGNSAARNSGGGAYASTFNNSIVFYNFAPSNSNYDNCTFNYSCTTPNQAGEGNITSDPGFVDLAGNNFHLQSNSPCINTGTNAYASAPTDCDGRSRILGGTVDIGAFEYQGAAIGELIGWLQQYSIPTDGSADFADTDHDGMNNWQEWIAGTNPTNSSSFLKMLAPARSNASLDWVLSWQSVTNRSYYIQRSTNFSSQTFLTISTNIPGQPVSTTFTDTNTVGIGSAFYRVGVQ